MTDLTEPLPPFLSAPPRTGSEIDVTGKWVAGDRHRRFRRPPESGGLLDVWHEMATEARTRDGVLSTEVADVVGADAVLVHQRFADAAALSAYYATAAADRFASLARIARPQIQMVRGHDVPVTAVDAIATAGVQPTVGEWIYGYARTDDQPDPPTAVQVTATWRCAPGASVDELKYWWQRVGTDAYDIEPGLIRFEAYDVPGSDALIIHETFDGSDELKFHLTKGTAARYKRDIDRIAAPDAYFFRGRVAWTIRTYSRFMRLPATYAVER